MIPENEMGVIVAFVRQSIGKVEIITIDAAFPDAIIEYNGQKYRAEFEFVSSNFFRHGHDPRKCDLVICWRHDAQNLILPVWELSREDWLSTPVLPAIEQREIAYWRQRALSLEIEVKALRKKITQEGIDPDGVFECHECHMQFKNRFALSAHMRAHTGKAADIENGVDEVNE